MNFDEFDQIIERAIVITTEIYILIGIFLFGGVVKGALGIGLPTLLIGFLTFFYEPRAAVAMILFSIMAANMRQAIVGGSMWDIVKRYSYFCAFASVGIFLVALVGSKVPLPILQTSVGISMVIFALSSLFVKAPKLNKECNCPACLNVLVAGLNYSSEAQLCNQLF